MFQDFVRGQFDFPGSPLAVYFPSVAAFPAHEDMVPVVTSLSRWANMGECALAPNHHRNSLRLVKRGTENQTKQDPQQPRQAGSPARMRKVALTVTGGVVALLLLASALL